MEYVVLLDVREMVTFARKIHCTAISVAYMTGGIGGLERCFWSPKRRHFFGAFCNGSMYAN